MRKRRRRSFKAGFKQEAVLLAHDALAGETASRTFFRDLAGEDLGVVEAPAPRPVVRDVPLRRPSLIDDGDPAFDV